MEWIKKEPGWLVEIRSWCKNVKKTAMDQAENLAVHPKVYGHIALMPDCHPGYGMPVGGVVACEGAVIPNAVGVDIGCGMCSVRTSIPVSMGNDKSRLRKLCEEIKKYIPCGEGKSHKTPQKWGGMNFDINDFSNSGWMTDHVKDLAHKNLGTLGGGNHFMEVQAGDDGFLWLMIHTGSRHLGNIIAKYHNEAAVSAMERHGLSKKLKELAFLYIDEKDGQEYIKDMGLAMEYAMENRNRIMDIFMGLFSKLYGKADFPERVNIHHNYASFEEHYNKKLVVQRKGATSAKKGEMGIIPGSMGTSSYIVKGLGNISSFKSCSHGAGRVMGRMEASRRLNINDCSSSMEGIVYDRWKKMMGRRFKKKNAIYDFGEAPAAYKNIDEVMNSQKDLVEIIVKLKPVAVVKG